MNTHPAHSPGLLATASRALLACVCFMLAGSSEAAEKIAKEYQIKAAFLYNFTRYIEWPESRFADAESPIVIGVLGNNPFGEELRSIVHRHKVNGREVMVRSVATVAEQQAVHILFVANGAETHLGDTTYPGRLTVGESERFTALGGMVTFISEANRVRFIVNQRAATEAQLKVSSQLLKLASAVRRKE